MRGAKPGERRRTVSYVDAKSGERNEADGRFSAAEKEKIWILPLAQTHPM
jgi:hypothetical protein